MATTGAPGNIPLFDDNTPVTPIQAPFNAIAVALNSALTAIIKSNGVKWALSKWNSTTDAKAADVVIQSGTASGTTSGTGVLTTAFPTAFPNECLFVILTALNDGGQAAAPVVVSGGVSASTFQTFWADRGSAKVKVGWIAVGR